MDAPIPDTRRWIRRKLKHITISTVIIILIIVGFFAWLSWHFYIGDDLILDMNANQTSFHITNVDVAPVEIAIGTRGQLFCTAQCEFSMRDANNHVLANDSFALSADESKTKTFILEPGRVGEGQKLYSATASCVNVRSWICPTLAPERRKTVLFTVNYKLPGPEEQAKAFLKVQLTGMLEALRETDVALLSVKELLNGNPRLHPGALLGVSTTLQETFAQETLFVENSKTLWAQQSYSDLDRFMSGADITNASILETRDSAQLLYAEMLKLPDTHNKLRNDLDQARADVNATISMNLSNPVLWNGAEDLAQATNTAVATYAADQFEYHTLGNNITLIRTAMLTFRNNSEQIIQDGVASGNALLSQLVDKCRNNASCGHKNKDNATNLTSITEICTVLDETADALSYREAYCTPNSRVFLNMSMLLPLQLTLPNVTSTLNTTLPENVPECCVFGACKPCCTDGVCADDAASYPVVFVHGHAFSGAASPEYSLGGYFSKIQQRLQEDGYIDAGIITPSSSLSEVQPGEWGVSGHPVSVRVTYYYNFYRDGEEYVLIPQKSENIETYAIRLKEMVELIKHHTGKKKVNIVAHSMGGLVARRYIQLFGEDSVNEVILVATPNRGITSTTLRLCPVLGESKECSDMAAGSVFMQKLNDPANQPKNVKVITIRGLGCEMGSKDGDGVATGDSVVLSFAHNYYLRGNCTDLFGSDFHTEILNVDKYPVVYEFISKELRP
jgi:hypothetical protein